MDGNGCGHMPKFQKLPGICLVSIPFVPRVFFDDTRHPNQNSVWEPFVFTGERMQILGATNPQEEVASAHEEYFQRLKDYLIKQTVWLSLAR